MGVHGPNTIDPHVYVCAQIQKKMSIVGNHNVLTVQVGLRIYSDDSDRFNNEK